MNHKFQKTSSLFIEDDGEAKRALNEGKCAVMTRETKRPKFNLDLMEEVLSQNNLNAAFKRVKRNKGAAGVDGMRVDELKSHIHDNFWKIKEALLTGRYQPSPVRKVEIPKPCGGVRQLGIPTVMDRFIQQALAQVLQKGFDPTFSDNSFGFRPKRSAHQAIQRSKSIQNDGYGFVVDLDLAKFFDEVNHDRLMSKLAQNIRDKRVLKLIRKYLQAGILDNGLVTTPDKGTPQGGPLSPLLSNIVLDELDRELEARGHKFVRYADDCNIYVKSERAGLRVMDSVSRFIEGKLKLKVNQEKSKVTRPCESQFLGFSFTGGWDPEVRSEIGVDSIKRIKSKIRELTKPTRRVSFESLIMGLKAYLDGWKGYFGKCDHKFILKDIDHWVRRRLRSYIWQQWRRSKTRFRKLQQFGVNANLAKKTACMSKGAWRASRSLALSYAFPNAYFDRIGLPRLHENKLLT